jgi:hypothetical protein
MMRSFYQLTVNKQIVLFSILKKKETLCLESVSVKIELFRLLIL